MTWVATAVAILGAATTYYNGEQVAKKQDNQLAAQLRQQGSRQREADVKVNELIDKTAKSNPGADKADVLGKYLDQIRAQSGNATAGLTQAGATSDAYKKSGNDAALGINDYGTKISGLLSRIDAPALQRNREGIDAARFETDINRIKRFSLGDDYLAKLKFDQIRRNPWLDAAAAAANGYAGSKGSGGTASTGATGTTAFGYGSFT